LKLTNHFLRTPCVNLKLSCPDSRSAAANSWFSCKFKRSFKENFQNKFEERKH
jgi:hypothetical protein